MALTPHLVAAYLLYFNNPKKFEVRNSKKDDEAESQEKRIRGAKALPPPPFSVWDSSPRSIAKPSLPKEIQEAVLLLNATKELGELPSTIKAAAGTVLSSVTDSVVYLQDDSGQFLVSSDHFVHKFPTTGIAATSQRERRVISDREGLDESDPLGGLLPSAVHPLKYGKTVLCCPVTDQEKNSVVAFFAIVCDCLTAEQERNIDFLLKVIVSTYHRLKLLNNNMSESQTEAILQLCGDLHDQDAASLQLKVIRYLEKHTASEIAFLLLAGSCGSELFCQVIGDRVLQDELRFSADTNFVSSALLKKQSVSLQDLSQDDISELQETVGKKVHSFLCVPVIRQGREEVIALACIANKNTPEQSFTQADIDTIHHCFKYTATVLTSTLAFQNERKLKNQTQALLQVAKNLFTHLDDLTNLLREIMQEARNLTHAERCSVFLLDRETDELVAKVFDGSVTNDSQDSEIRIPVTQGIAGHVVTTGEILNIHDAYSHPLFYRRVDDATGFKTRNILCFPIKDENETIVGVAQLCNKINAKSFTAFDVDIAKAFSIYCCISIVHSLLYKKVQGAQYRSRLATELMIYHMQVNQEDVDDLAKCHVPPPKSFDPGIANFFYTPRGIPELETPLVIISMMDDMGFLSKYRIRRDTLARFILMVRKGYREPPYHNWMHAVSVAHFCYLLDANIHLNQYLTDVEVLALFIACMCHDIDHRGTNNSFQVASQSVLAALYSSEGSVMERHHFAQTMCILNTDGCNIFENLRRKDYEQVLDLIRDIILATDITHHLRILRSLRTMADDGYSKSNPRHRKLLLSLLMTSSDLCDQTKPWENATKIAEMIYKEFFSQGDLEKALGKNPLEMMDRDKACIPNLQIEFLDKIAAPVYQLLADLFPAAQAVTHAVTNNRKKWQDVSENLHTRKLSISGSLEIFNLLANKDSEHNAQNGESSSD